MTQDSRSQSGKPIYPPFYFLAALLLMAVLHLAAPIRLIIHYPYRFLGLLVLTGGLALILWVAGIFDRAGTTIKPFEESSALVTAGPFRVSRNPVYLGMVLGLLGVAVLAGSLSPFLVIPLFAVLIDRRFIQAEEAQLERTFGASYLAYKTRVRRWM